MNTILLLAASAVAIYILACAIWPFSSCPRCDGTSKLRSPSGKAWRPCPRCTGTGKRIRIGRRAWNALRNLGSS